MSWRATGALPSFPDLRRHLANLAPFTRRGLHKNCMRHSTVYIERYRRCHTAHQAVARDSRAFLCWRRRCDYETGALNTNLRLVTELKIVKQVHRWVYRLTSLGHQHWVVVPACNLSI